MSWKHLFSKSLAADPERLHFAAHSHHLWPDASHDGHMAAWQDAAALADHKWDKIMGPVWSEAQQHVADELKLPDPATLCFAPNTHDFIVRLLSAIPARPVRVLATDGEFHSFRRQMIRWVESGEVVLQPEPPDSLLETARTGEFDLIFASHVLFNSGTIISALDELAALARPEGPWVVIDGYHGFKAIETDLSQIADRVFYLGGGYKYAMAGEGACFLHAPQGFAERPVVTGWYAAFDDLALAPGDVGYGPDGRRFLGSTFDPSGLYRFNAVQNMLDSEGLTTVVISDHVAALQAQFLEDDPLADFELLNPLGDQQHARFLAFRGEAASALHDRLAKQNVVTDVRGNVLRIGFALYHDRHDVARLTKIIRELT
ncbi:class V aminotransferase [uncultured Parasphingorhabdus sp.]|uniref:kynureninase/PvdN C-terminal domain-containing protein n=1 Tax=uncultured Parasphingorhabdus sp. TaxID=2709694 RepID=UPI0030DCD9B6|tara:strand:+ start:8982 stop:10103 length:1122 start_codon:yes stop_codon:yes gene_type:complete